MTASEGRYTRELAVAIQAALDAGRILREDFHRPGGPRGSGHHAVADGEAEALIRGALIEAFPEYAYLGEETGYRPGSGSSPCHVWVVDPNDGTSAYLKGFRGAAVSIALLRDGRPVLGVVYAHCAPDDGGDLFSWAEGSGPVQRNGRAVPRKWPVTAGPECTALVSQSADKSPRANALAAHPMRFRAVTGIAYRLALVAAGEGELAVSLNGPCAWDYAGGHALLLGAGADLFGAQGHPVTYGPDGRSSCGGACFGGPSALVAEMVGRDWSSVLHHGHPEEGYLQLSWPVRGRTVPVAGVLSRGQGCLLGQFAGDSLGGLVEFKGADYIASHYPQGVRLLADGGTWRTIAGQPTDDSELALCLARSIVAAGGYDPEAAARAYAWWYNSGPFDKGDTTRQALIPAARAFGHGQSAADAARAAASTTSQANGAMMRVCPIGVAGASRSPDTVTQWARADAELTHPHPVCQSANAVFAEAIAFAIRVGASPAETYEHACATAAEIGAETSVRETLALAASAAPADYSKQQGWVLIALQNAFFQLLHAPDLEAGVVDSIMRGGDTDTNAAIAGALLGAVHGRDAIPSQWVDRILTCRPLEGLSGGNKSRPQAFWPVDALWLAELLLTATKGDAQP